MAKPWEKYASAKPWEKYQSVPEAPEEAQKFGPVQALLEKAGESFSMGLTPYAQAGADVLVDRYFGDEGPSYDQRVEKFRQRARQISEDQPLPSLVGNIIGFAGPGKLAGSLVKGGKGLLKISAANAPKILQYGDKIGTLAAEGALLGGAYTPETGVSDVGARAEGAASGAKWGAIVPVGIDAGVGAAKMAAKAPKFILSSLGGVRKDVIDEFLKDPNRYVNAKSRDQVMELIGTQVDELNDAVTAGKMSVNDAKAAVKDLTRQIKEGKSDKHKAVKELLKDAQARLSATEERIIHEMRARPAPTNMAPQVDDAIGGLKQDVISGSRKAYDILGERQFDVSPARGRILQAMEDLSSRGSDAAKTGVKKLKEYEQLIFNNSKTNDAGALETPASKIKQTIQDIDSDLGIWNQTTGSFDDAYTRALKGLRAELDGVLKKDPEYAQQMAKVAKDTDLVTRSSKAFGDPQRAINRLSGIARPQASIDRELLAELGQRTGQDFVSPVEDYAKTQNFLRSPLKQQAAFEKLPEQGEVKGLLRQEALAKRELKPQNLRSLVEGSNQQKNLNMAQRLLKQAEAEKKKMAGWTRLTLEGKVNSVMRGKQAVRDQLTELSKMSDQDFVKMVDDLRVNEAFTKDFTRGSRNVNLWALLGNMATSGSTIGATGGLIVGGPAGLAFGAVTGAMLDKYGPQMTKQILLATTNLKGRPTYQALRKLKLPDAVAHDLSRAFFATAVVKKSRTQSEKGLLSDQSGLLEPE